MHEAIHHFHLVKILCGWCLVFTYSVFILLKMVLIELSSLETWQQIVVNQFSRVASNERCSFFGNISLGSDISLSELREIYDVVSFHKSLVYSFLFWHLFHLCLSFKLLALFDQVVVAYGAESDRSLGVAGEVSCFLLSM